MNITSTQEIRTHFKALRRIHRGVPVAYFDGPGGTQIPSSVVEAMTDYLYNHNANTHWAYPSSHETDELLMESRNTLADFLNATPSEIAFGANMTTLTFHLARAIGRHLNAGNEVLVTELDHHANIDPWHSLVPDFGIKVRTVKMIPETGQLDWRDLERKLSSNTKVLAIGAASNALGTINNIKRAVDLAHGVGAKVFVDAVHYAPHELVDVKAFGCDFLACSAYKFYGPHVGILFGRANRLQALDFPKLQPGSNMIPERAETGTLNHEGIVGAAAAVDFLASLASGQHRRSRLKKTFDELQRRSKHLLMTLWEGLSAIDRVVLYGPTPEEKRTPTISFTINGKSAEAVCHLLSERGIFASHGDFYATTVVQRLGLNPAGLVRVGCACYTTHEEVERLVTGVDEIAHK